MREHAETHSADIARPPCLASQPEIVDTLAKSEHSIRGSRGGFVAADRVTRVEALEKHLWQGML